jgi:hypothetical protein
LDVFPDLSVDGASSEPAPLPQERPVGSFGRTDGDLTIAGPKGLEFSAAQDWATPVDSPLSKENTRIFIDGSSILKKDDRAQTDGGWFRGWNGAFLIAEHHCVEDGFLVDMCLPENFKYVNGHHRSPNPFLADFQTRVKRFGCGSAGLDRCIVDCTLPSGAQGGGDLHLINSVKFWEKEGRRALIVTYDLFNEEIRQGHVTLQWVKDHTIKPKWDPRTDAYIPDTHVD